jgi:hypothetical protein
MRLAQQIARGAIQRRDCQIEIPAMQAVIARWADRLFWALDAEEQVRALEKALAADKDLARELARAVQWDQPVADSSELNLKAVDAARGMIAAPDPEIWAGELDWEDWKAHPDRQRLQEIFERNDAVRNAFAEEVGLYPGKRNFTEVARMAVRQLQQHGPNEPAVRAVLEQRILRWETFLAGGQDAELARALEQSYEFRQELAQATGFRGEEAERLAQFAVRMLQMRASSPRHKKRRQRMLDHLGASPETQALVPALAEIVNLAPEDDNGWTRVQTALAECFAGAPGLSSRLWEEMKWPRPFALVLREELRQMEVRRQNAALPGAPEELLADTALDASDLAAHKGLFGVAFSGGGIRSATFCLGILQKLSHFGLLRTADYLSTVSGGGYAGAWLAGWNYRNGLVPYASFLAGQNDLLAPACPDPRADPQRPVRFLREFSNYLTPKLGSFSFDTWTLAAVYTRNLALNQAVLFTFFAALLIVPRWLGIPMLLKGYGWRHGLWMAGAACFLLLVAVAVLSVNLRNAVGAATSTDEAEAPPAPPPKRALSFPYGPGWLQALVVGTMLGAVYLGSLWMWIYVQRPRSVFWICAGAFFFLLSLLLAWVGGFVKCFRRRLTGRGWWPVVLALVAIGSAGASLALLRLDIQAMLFLKHRRPAGLWHATIWGPVMLLAVLIVPGILQVGLMGVDLPDAGREWLSRFRAVCSIYATYWILGLSAAIYGPLLMFKLMRWSVLGAKVWVSGLTLGWILTTVSGLLAGSGRKTGTDAEGNPKFTWFQVLAKIAPPVFIAGLVLWIATLEQLLLAHGVIAKYSFDTLIQEHWRILNPLPIFSGKSWLLAEVGWLTVALVIGGGILAWRVDINEFSMHHFYKNRLVRCYLGASHTQRDPDPFTGFDEADDVALSELRAAGAKRSYLGPYPILNATLNLSAGKQLAWQERKAASFIFSPCFCGFDVEGGLNARTLPPAPPAAKWPKRWNLRPTRQPCGYRDTSGYSYKGGPRIGTAMAISGAAANPNQGYNTSPTVAFLLTVFDVRLGWWLGNPRLDFFSRLSSPRFGLAALIAEVLGTTDDRTRFVNLSDGGHFDNMGIYELVRRRCKFILLCDAEQDPEYKFEGLGAAIRKCRIDFGAIIEIDPIRIRPKSPGAMSESHCAVGKITYLDGSEGTLVYIKSSLTGDEPEDITQYHAAERSFPHESTADQWFGESQFESYRALGYHAAESALGPATAWLDWKAAAPDVSNLFTALREYWYPVNPNLKESASAHTGTLADLLERIRQNPGLKALGGELFPGGAAGLPEAPRSAAEEFYFSMCVIQLMEDIYFEFQLDRKEWFDDPRISGWRHLFHRWKAVPAIAAAWAAERDTFRKDFHIFWNSL